MRLEVNPGDGLGGDGIGFAGEWGHGTIVKNVEAADAVVEVVVSEELGKVHGLIFHCWGHSVFYRFGFNNRLRSTDLPYILPYILHYLEAEA